jgi:5-hydroxyisourate hydrolase-like protein (transthyretin family)
MNGQPAENVDVEIVATTNDGTAVLQRDAAGNAGAVKTDHLGHGRFVVDVPRTFSITYLDIKV